MNGLEFDVISSRNRHVYSRFPEHGGNGLSWLRYAVIASRTDESPSLNGGSWVVRIGGDIHGVRDRLISNV